MTSKDESSIRERAAKEGETRREIEDLKKKLAMEKKRTKRIKLLRLHGDASSRRSGSLDFQFLPCLLSRFSLINVCISFL
ncbi:unnamed protein product [Arabis nemorensis]|uniref:Uncharacterized protein n=1 Tax=Arabis nemorensis TaxID=586526 RepID=A0A565B4K3_9BRAS|nr:unnamed protein product [Arabis nemorensis]